jgi:uncharacterized protein (DUF433 family)
MLSTRIDVATIVGAVVGGESCEEVKEAFDLTREQILAALRFIPEADLQEQGCGEYPDLFED